MVIVDKFRVNPPELRTRPDGKAPGIKIAIFAAVLVGMVAFGVIAIKQDFLDFFTPNPSEDVQLRIVVKDLSDHPIPSAQVRLEDGPRNLSGITNSGGYTNYFALRAGGPGAVKVVVNANGFERRPIYMTRPAKDETATVILTRVQDKSSGSNDLTAKRLKFTLTGTWEIEAPDQSDWIIRSGSFTFSRPQKDGSVDVQAQFAVVSFFVRLHGTCTLTGRVADLTFAADAGSPNTWKGIGNFRFESATRITGSLQSIRGDDVPFVLVKKSKPT